MTKNILIAIFLVGCGSTPNKIQSDKTKIERKVILDQIVDFQNKAQKLSFSVAERSGYVIEIVRDDPTNIEHFFVNTYVKYDNKFVNKTTLLPDLFDKRCKNPEADSPDCLKKRPLKLNGSFFLDKTDMIMEIWAKDKSKKQTKIRVRVIQERAAPKTN